jgi:hypothetical protein
MYLHRLTRNALKWCVLHTLKLHLPLLFMHLNLVTKDLRFSLMPPLLIVYMTVVYLSSVPFARLFQRFGCLLYKLGLFGAPGLSEALIGLVILARALTATNSLLLSILPLNLFLFGLFHQKVDRSLLFTRARNYLRCQYLFILSLFEIRR